MTKTRILLLIGTIMALIVAIGATAAFAQDGEETPESAPTETPQDEGVEEDAETPSNGLFGHRGFDGAIAGLTSEDELLAEALGIDIEELQAAQTAARQAALEQAVEQAVEAGTITQEQADAILENGLAGRGFGFHGRGGFDFHGFGGHGFLDRGLGGDQSLIDYDALLAGELGISVDELQAAREEVSEARLAEMIEAGIITEEQAELMQAQAALKETIDHEALTATALGISVDELQAALEDGQAISDLIEDAGMTTAEFGEAMQAAYEAAVQDAVDSGVITQAQADEILANGYGLRGFAGPRGFDGHNCPGGPGKGKPGGFFGLPGGSTSSGTNGVTGTSI